jgi:PKHD-type hydroxylase
MNLLIKNFLALESCDRIISDLNKIGWLGHKNKNIEYNQAIKKHLQLDGEDHPTVKGYSGQLSQAIIDHKLVIYFTQPKAIKELQFNCYKDGGSYGRHSDNAVMGTDPKTLRTDYTVGLLLTDGYEGGEVILERHDGVIEKPQMAKGDLIVYNCGIMHWVEPVTKGERIIGIGWIESKFINQAEREIASCTQRLYESLLKDKGMEHPLTQEASSIYHNLCRRWGSR